MGVHFFYYEIAFPFYSSICNRTILTGKGAYN
jgi:hypothetical protein